MIVADTHALIWWVTDPRSLSVLARDAFDKTEVIGLPAIVCWEVAFLAERRRIAIDVPAIDWLHEVLMLPGVYAVMVP